MMPISDIEYLAIPYSDKSDNSEDVMEFRARVSDIICADLMNQGRLIYAPISSCHHIAKKYGLPRDWQFWQHMDREFVRICKKVNVITLQGWKESTGVNAEMGIANECDIPIEYIDPTPYLIQLEEEINKCTGTNIFSNFVKQLLKRAIAYHERLEQC